MTELDREAARIGILGTGAIAQIVHLPILSERTDVDLSAVSDLDDLKAKELADRFGVDRVLSDIDLIEDAELDAIVICTPNSLHEDLAVRALESGKHVLVERPMALTGAGVQRVLDAAAAAGRCLMVGMGHRFRPEVGVLRSFVASGELGEVYAVRASSLVRHVPHSRSAWRQNPAEAGGGALMDLGVVGLDLALWLVGYPAIERVSAVFERDGDGVESACTVHMVSVEGIAFSVEVSWKFFADADRHYARVMGREGSAQLLPLEVSKKVGGRPMDITPRQPTPRGGENPFKNAHRRLLDQFVRSIRGTCDVELPREQAQLMTVIEAAYRSAEEGAEVRL
jgi:predicted dehydrogenase